MVGAEKKEVESEVLRDLEAIKNANRELTKRAAGDVLPDEMVQNMVAENIEAAQHILAELDREKEVHKKFFEDYAAAIATFAEITGVGHHWQDEEGVVYRVEVPKGKFVYYEKYELTHTRRLSQGEKAGRISMKEARELGYEVE